MSQLKLRMQYTRKGVSSDGLRPILHELVGSATLPAMSQLLEANRIADPPLHRLALRVHIVSHSPDEDD